jgi:hypothetical protein
VDTEARLYLVFGTHPRFNFVDFTLIKFSTSYLNTFHHSVQNLLSSIFKSKNTSTKIHKTVILLVYWCEILSFISSEERKIRVFEVRAFSKIYGPKMDEVTGQWGRLHKEQLRVPH